MKTYSITTVCWPFDRLFPSNKFVFGDFHDGFGRKVRACIGEVRLSKLRRNPGDPRTLRLSVHESRFSSSVMHTGHLPSTLRDVEDRDMYYRGSATQAEWFLKPGEQALDGAIRVARSFFKLINLRTESPAHSFEDLIPHFVVYEHTQVFNEGQDVQSLEGWLRQKHRLKPSLIDTWRLDWLYSPWDLTIGQQSLPHSDCCHSEGGSLKFNFPDMEARVAFCPPCERHWFRPDPASKDWIVVDSYTGQILKLRFGLVILGPPRKTEADYNSLSGIIGP